MVSWRGRHPGDRPESIGELLVRIRAGHGLSQQRLAELLCAAAGTPTVTRHEVSRWERNQRVPGAFWLSWLAVVLDTPLEQLEVAAAATQRPPQRRPLPVDQRRLWRPPSAADLLAVLDHTSVADARDLAHAWLAGPVTPAAPEPGGRAGSWADGTAVDALTRWETRLAELRRQDDQVGGLDHAGLVARELRAVVGVLRMVGTGDLRRRALPLVAGFAQLAGWAHADAGESPAARRAYQVALQAACAAGDTCLAAHVLGALSHHSLATGDATEALLLARSGQAGMRSGGSALTRALLLHRVAFAAARTGERREAELALAAADQAADRAEPGREPDWLYWLDPAERQAMTGRCLAALGRPLRATGLLSGRRRARTPVRAAAVYGAWLARCYLALGEVERACRHADWAWRDAVAGGSQRAVDQLRHLHPLLLRFRGLPALRWYERRYGLLAGFLPDAERIGHPVYRAQPSGPWRWRASVTR